MNARLVSIVIPTFKEESSIAGALSAAWRLNPHELVVCDGGSPDGTMTAIANWRQNASHDQRARTRVVESLPGRGTQLAAAAKECSGDVFLFLHADNRLAIDAFEQMRVAGWPRWGGFRQRIDDPSWRFRWLETGNALRARFRHMLFGDQAMFVQAELYHRVGGFEPIPLMEDVRLSDQLRQIAHPSLLAGPVVIDARRWHRRGVMRQTLLNWRIQWAHRRGTSPAELADWYR